MNPIKELREALGWSQSELARRLGVSYPSVQNYEHGRRVPEAVIEKLKALASTHGLNDIAVTIAGDWQVTRVFQPGETLISQARNQLARNEKLLNEAVDWRAMLDEILSSGQMDAISAVQGNLLCCVRLVRARRPKARAITKKPAR